MENISIEFIINMVVLIGGIFALVKSNNDIRKELSDFKDETRKEMSDIRIEMSGMREELRIEMSGMREELRKEMSDMRDEFRIEMSNMREEFRKEMSDMRDEFRKEMSDMRDEFRIDNTSIKIELVKLQHRFDKIEGKYTDLHAMILEIKTQHDSQFLEIKTTIASQANKNEVINERLNQIQTDVETQKSLKDFIQGLTTAMKTPQQQL